MKTDERYVRDPEGCLNDDGSPRWPDGEPCYPNDAHELPDQVHLSIGTLARIVGWAAGLEFVICEPGFPRDAKTEREMFALLNKMLMDVAVASRIGDHALGWATCGIRTAGFSGLGFVDVDSPEGQAIVANLENTPDTRVIVECPRCRAEQEDLDGFGVLACDACGYCAHPHRDGDDRGRMVCVICGDIDDGDGDHAA